MTGQQRMVRVVGAICDDCGRAPSFYHAVTCPHDPTEAERLKAAQLEAFRKRLHRNAQMAAAQKRYRVRRMEAGNAAS